MEKIIFALPGNESITNNIAHELHLPVGEMILRSFPDEETYVRVLSNVSSKNVILVSTLYQPDSKLLPLYFLAKLLKDLGAARITLVSPYLSYMRQDKRFHDGEAITSEYFAALVSSFVDELITVDPHLHRRNSMAEIYTIPCKVLHAAPLISSWIKNNIEMPLLVGPDSESEQWVAETAAKMNTPYIVLNKERISDNEVKIAVPKVDQFKNHTPVLVDDIISTAKTMITTTKHLMDAGLKAVTCIGVHGLFAGDAYEDLLKTGAGQIITCNTIPHISNKIDVSDLIIGSLD